MSYGLFEDQGHKHFLAKTSAFRQGIPKANFIQPPMLLFGINFLFNDVQLCWMPGAFLLITMSARFPNQYTSLIGPNDSYP